jgi:CheY-like chemotaxis protein
MTREHSLYPDANQDATQPPLLLAGLQILVVDDDDDSRFYISTVLEGDGASVTAVASAADALEVIPQLQPHVLVCDIGMPDQDGYTFIRKVRVLGAEKGGSIPAVALTAYASSEDRARALEAGFQTHVPKPVDPSELVAVVADVVAHGLD